ncbi:MAG: hypothetical protein HY685_00885 [Chloroflexi bacterium]|nr:hypothetical protein [Chloroflexota bacterium]
MKVVAVNIQPYATLEQWRAYWRSLGAADVLWANDTPANDVAVRFEVIYLGTIVLIDRAGQIVYRGVAPSYEVLRGEIEKVL